ncbi:CcdB family protein [Mangrovicoccus ximenensis]|uniref:CcdB family protein n=1 Tax=Mangrovicoccus ximenensis TaxID=1911570 RepID=UPI000D3C52AB|nr:CcdB family protein [Mangrovicoccus ximenensis]
MAQGDIHRTRDGRDLICRVQTDLGVDTPYVLCAPVLPRAEWGALVPKLHIPVRLGGVPHVILMSQMVAIPAREIGPVTGSAAAWRDEIVAAVDLLVSGF